MMLQETIDQLNEARAAAQAEAERTYNSLMKKATTTPLSGKEIAALEAARERLGISIHELEEHGRAMANWLAAQKRVESLANLDDEDAKLIAEKAALDSAWQKFHETHAPRAKRYDEGRKALDAKLSERRQYEQAKRNLEELHPLLFASK